MNFLFVDGSNAVMRAAWGGDIEPAHAAPVATGMIERAIRLCQATHLIIALDCPNGGEVTNWRRLEYPQYKADRTRDTGPWLTAAWKEWSKLGWFVENQAGYEADDIIATLVSRVAGRVNASGAATSPGVFIYSSDSDLLPLTGLGATILKPEKGGMLNALNAADVCRLKNIATPGALVDVKSMTGEKGDNIPGVPTIGEMRATHLLRAYGTLDNLLAGHQPGGGNGWPLPNLKHADLVRSHSATVLLARKLITLCSTVPIPLIQPKACQL